MGPETCVRAVSGLSACVPDWEGDSDPGGGHLRGRGRKAAPRDRVLVGKCILRPSRQMHSAPEPRVSPAGPAACDFQFDAALISLAMQDGKQCGQITG